MRIHDFSNGHFRQLYTEQTPFPTGNRLSWLSTPYSTCWVGHVWCRIHMLAHANFPGITGISRIFISNSHIKCGFAVWIMALAAREVFFTGLLKETSASALKIISGSEGLGLAMQKDVLPGEEIHRSKALKVHQHTLECQRVEAICKARGGRGLEQT